MSRDVDSKRVLLVEGSSDEHVVKHIWKSLHGDSTPFKIIDKQGINNLLPSIPLEFSVYGREIIGILIDANNDPDGRWKELTSQLENHLRVQVPVRPERSGTIIEDQPRVGIWMMPNNNSSGELENFIYKLIPDGDPIWPRSCDYIDKIPLGDRKFSNHKKLRAQIHAWLATRKRPRPMGAAIGCGDLDVHQSSANEFYEWLRRLFIEESSSNMWVKNIA